MRKEKSRDAARSRRGKENYEFYELAKMLPLPAAITTQLDKASIIRLTISYLKLRDFSAHGDPPWNRDAPPSSPASHAKNHKGSHLRSRVMSPPAYEIFELHQGTHILQSLDGFAFALAADGRFLYISETVSIYLGLSQVEMSGSSVFDYCHQEDHAELAEQLGINLSQSQPLASPGSSDDGSPSTPTGMERQAPLMTMNSTNLYRGTERSFCIRMKSTLTKRGCHFKSSGYRVVLVLSHLRTQYSFSHNRKQPPTVLGMLALAIALPPPSVNEVRLESDMFVTRLAFDFRIVHCEAKVSDLLNYTAEELTGKNMYSLCHGMDTQTLRKCHLDLIKKGQVMSPYYRLICRNGGYVWLQTCATVICNKNSEDQSIVCVNYVLSHIEYDGCILDYSQLPQNLKPDDSADPNQGGPTSESEKKDEASTRDNETPDDTSGGPESTPSDHILTRMSSKQDSRRQTTPIEVGQDFYDKDIIKNQSASDGKLSKSVRTSRKRKMDLLSSTSPSNAGSVATGGGSASSSSLSPLGSTSDFLTNGGDRGVSPAMQEDTPPPHHHSSSESEEGVVSVVARPWKRSPAASLQQQQQQQQQQQSTHRTSFSEANGTSSLSVKELEDAMNKHLPSHDDISQRMAMSGQSQRSTIQWIGGPPASLPASSLLRQIYVNRESVIRSGSHVTRSPYYSEVQSTLPTPPNSGNEPFGDQFMLPANTALPPTYSSYVDTYSATTPPASVSPRDKFPPGLTETPAFSEAAAAAAAAAIPHMHHYVPEAQHLPLKPQVFVHPGTLDPYIQPTLTPEQQLYAAHHAAAASSFHLYHPSTPSVKSTNSNSWYSLPDT